MLKYTCMLDNTPIKVGDELVEYGKVYKVFAIKDKVMYDGKTEKHVFFKPLYQTSDNRTLTCAIPLKNIPHANIRRPLCRKTMNELLTVLADEIAVGTAILDATEAKEVLKLNNPFESARVLRSIFNELNDLSLNATKSRKDVFELSIKTLSQEVAFVFGLTLEKAEQKLERALKKSLS